MKKEGERTSKEPQSPFIELQTPKSQIFKIIQISLDYSMTHYELFKAERAKNTF